MGLLKFIRQILDPQSTSTSSTPAGNEEMIGPAEIMFENFHISDVPRRPTLPQPPTTDNHYSAVIYGTRAAVEAPREPVSQLPTINHHPEVNIIPNYDAPRKPLLGERSNINGLNEKTTITNVTKPFVQTPPMAVTKAFNVIPPLIETLAKETKVIMIQPLQTQSPAKKEITVQLIETQSLVKKDATIQPFQTQSPAKVATVQPLQTQSPAKKTTVQPPFVIQPFQTQAPVKIETNVTQTSKTQPPAKKEANVTQTSEIQPPAKKEANVTQKSKTRPPAKKEANVTQKTKTQPPAKKEANVTHKSKTQPPAKKEANATQTSKTQPPAKKEANVTQTSKTQPPAKKEVNVTQTSKIQPPAKKEANVTQKSKTQPSAKKDAKVTQTSKTPPPAKKEANVTQTSKIQPPAKKEANVTKKSKTQPPAKKEVNVTQTSKTQPSIKKEANVLQTSKTQPPAKKEANVTQKSKTQPPAKKEANVTQTSKTQPPAKEANVTQTSKTQPPAKKEANVTQTSKIQPPAKKEANVTQKSKTQPSAKETNVTQVFKSQPPAKKAATLKTHSPAKILKKVPTKQSQGKGGRKNNAGCKQKNVFQKKQIDLGKLSTLNPEKMLIELSCELNSLRTFIHKTFLGEIVKPINILLFARCLGKLSTVQFDYAKLKIFNVICETNFVEIFEEHCADLSQHDDATEFVQNILNFCETVVDLTPSLAVSQLKPLLEVVESRLHQRVIYTLELEKAFTITNAKFSKWIEENSKSKLAAVVFHKKAAKKVPQNHIRDIAIWPSKEDLFGEAGFVRPNIVEGAYNSVDHYLDVHFRLMREDFVTPLREALKEYKSFPKRKEYSGARFYKHARLNKYKFSRGVMVLELYIPAIKPKHPDDEIDDKLFMHDSLLCLSCDNFETVLICMVHDAYSMKHGKISVIEVWGKPVTDDMFAKNFVVAESNCYFAPYFNILKVLQSPHTAKNFPFKRYLVQSQADELPPDYLKHFQEYELFDGSTVKLTNNKVAKPWSKNIGLDATQYEAYTKALCRKFVTIQGPPGTGKTFIAKKIASTIITNCYIKENGGKQMGPILVVCCTNHALDQFLEGLLNVTNKLVRVGGQSKNENLDKYNLRNLRKGNHDIGRIENDLYENARHLQTFLAILKSIQSKDIIFDLTKNERMFYFRGEVISQRFDLPFDLESFLDDFGMEDTPLVDWLLLSDYDDDSKQNFIKCSLLSGKIVKSASTESETCQSFKELREKVHYTTDFVDFSLDEMRAEVGSFGYENGFKKKKGKRHNTLHRQLELNYLEMRLARGNFGYMKVRFSEEMDPFSFSPEQRWSLYWEWLDLAKANILEQFSKALKINQAEKMNVEEMKQIYDLNILKRNYVVGMTTSGAARNHSLLTALGAPIVIVEEAAEVMESHVVASLTKDCQHLIMIGDHQQLRPITATHKMGTQYNLDVSLFERMVNNGSHCYQLGVQHRMRPEIARLITPAIYKNLRNNSNVEKYPSIKGVAKSLFFIDHTVPEDKRGQSTSRSNAHEAKFLLKLANYLVWRGHAPQDITILSTYAEQTLLICSMRGNIPDLEDIEICNLDGYQGEENKIILLSLVRSNPEGNIGFLKTSNRVCVALSRAREGFFIIGNMSILKKKSPLWKAVNNTLTKLGSIGPSLLLQCQFHPDMKTEVKTANDFSKIPKGGCRFPCANLLSCGHSCGLVCHAINPFHEDFKCTQSCRKSICGVEGHCCPLGCDEECPSVCYQTRRVILPCGHELEMKCHYYSNYYTSRHPCDECFTRGTSLQTPPRERKRNPRKKKNVQNS